MLIRFLCDFFSYDSAAALTSSALLYLLGLLTGWILWGRHLARLRSDLAARQSELDQLRVEFDQLKDDHHTKIADIARLSNQLDERQTQLNHVINERRLLNEQLMAARTEIDNLTIVKPTEEPLIEPEPVVVVETPTPTIETDVPVVQEVKPAPEVVMPVVEPPVIQAPALELPVAEVPAVEAPIVEAPIAEVPVVETPVVETPVVETPVVETPVMVVPRVIQTTKTVKAEPIVIRVTNTTTTVRRVENTPPVHESVEPMVHAVEREETDDLTRIEGIGAKIADLLKSAGITTYSKLAATPVERLQEILNQGGSSFVLARPDTWPVQAGLLAQGDIARFKTYVGYLTAGVDTDGRGAAFLSGDTPQRVIFKSPDGRSSDDLTAIEGIGAKISELLKAAGINDWYDLSIQTPERISEILQAAGTRFAFHDPTTWPKQAALLNAQKWDEFKAYTEYLIAGRDPNVN